MVFRSDYENYFTAEQLEGEVRNHGERFATIIRLITKRAEPILDVGAGTGMLARTLAEKNYPAPVMNCDIKPDYVKFMKDKGLEAVEGDIRNLPFKDREFETVVATEVLEHLANPGDGLKEICRVAKRRVIFSLPQNSKDDFHSWMICMEKVAGWWVVEMERCEGND